jgi:hypothetical protein
LALRDWALAAAGVLMVRIDFNRLRFLVIDDNAHMRRILRKLLLSWRNASAS